MKTLIVVRHAKSSPAEFGQNDFDRPLNDRGKREAPEMARRLATAGITPDAFVSSPAKRARKTCTAFAESFGYKKDDIIFFESLYHCSAPVFYDTILKLDDKYSTVAIFAHNPGITDFVNTLCAGMIVEMPTCGVFAAEADIGHWSDFENAGRKFLLFKYPKEE